MSHSNLRLHLVSLCLLCVPAQDHFLHFAPSHRMVRRSLATAPNASVSEEKLKLSSAIAVLCIIFQLRVGGNEGILTGTTWLHRKTSPPPCFDVLQSQRRSFRHCQNLFAKRWRQAWHWREASEKVYTPTHLYTQTHAHTHKKAHTRTHTHTRPHSACLPACLPALAYFPTD